MRICCVSNCDNKADVVENNKDYCAECWWKKFSNTYISCVCDNHEWKTPGRVKQILDYVDVPFDENS